jgi:hypothetical protein
LLVAFEFYLSLFRRPLTGGIEIGRGGKVVEVNVHASEQLVEADDILLRARESLRKLSVPVPAAVASAVSAPTKLKWRAASDIPAAKSAVSRSASNPRFYALACALMILAGLALVWNSNQVYGPEMYANDGLVPAVEAFDKGLNYGVFDLNLNIRRLRDLRVSRMTTTPDVIVLGASQWQEANSGLVKGLNLYNSHIHRDYWQDMLGVTQIWAQNNRLPKRMIISIRDNLFRPISARTDYLWEPGIPYYRPMADRLGVEQESYWVSFPYQRIRQLFSISMLFDNVTRWYNASERPHASTQHQFENLDTLLPDGSIVWSLAHKKIFTHERARKEALSFADVRRNDPPPVEARGVEAFEKLLTFLKAQGVTVYLAEPPFNPIFYDSVQGSTYFAGVTKIDAMFRDMAKRHGLKMIGGFNPHKVGCDASMYIDAEHSNASCLKNIFEEFSALVQAEGGK